MTQDVWFGVLSVLLGTGLGIAWKVAAAYWQAHASDAQWQQVRMVVDAAEQIYGAGAGAEKLTYATDLLQQLFPKLDAVVIRAMVEATVRSLKAMDFYAIDPAPAPTSGTQSGA